MSREKKILIAVSDVLVRHDFSFLALDTGCIYYAPSTFENVQEALSTYQPTHVLVDIDWGRDMFKSCNHCNVIGIGSSVADKEEFKLMGVHTVVDKKVGYEDFYSLLRSSSEDIAVDERRKSSRITTKGWVVDARKNTAKLLDLSKEGARVEFIGLDDFDLDVSSCTIMPMLGVKKALSAQVRWKRRTDKVGGLEVGLAFDEKLCFYN